MGFERQLGDAEIYGSLRTILAVKKGYNNECGLYSGTGGGPTSSLTP